VTWVAALWARFCSSWLGRFLIAIAGVVVAVFAALVYGWHRGQKEQADEDAAKDATKTVQQAQAVGDAAKVRTEVDSEIAKLPDAPAQQIGTAAAGTAAGELRDDGWTRD
jgi:hypothetical protein